MCNHRAPRCAWIMFCYPPKRAEAFSTHCTHTGSPHAFRFGFTNSRHQSHRGIFWILWSERKGLWEDASSALTDVKLYRGDHFSVQHGFFRFWQLPASCWWDRGELHQSWWDRWNLLESPCWDDLAKQVRWEAAFFFFPRVLHLIFSSEERTACWHE